MSHAARTRAPPLDGVTLSLNELAAPLVERLLTDAGQLRLGVVAQSNGCTLIDAGVGHTGGVEAGRRIAGICMAGLGSVRITANGGLDPWIWQVEVSTSHPVLACLGCQYAGWSLSVDEGSSFHALGSGPGRSLAMKEPLFESLGYRDQAGQTALVLESDRLPPPALGDKVAEACGVSTDRLTLIITPTGSQAGVVQIAARVVEVALHKAHELGFPLGAILDGAGTAPVPPPSPDMLTAMGRTNDAILFGGQVHLHVSGPDEQAADLAARLPSRSSRDYGKPFAEVFAHYEHDFFRIDPMLFSPARVAVTAVDSGRTFFGGALDGELLRRSFGDEHG